MISLLSRDRKIISNTFLVLFVFFLEICFFRQIIFDSNNDSLVGENVDSRLNALVMEHWFRAAKFKECVLDFPFFHPIKGTLGYSDTVFLLAVPFVVLRYIGLNWLDSYNLTLILVHLFGGLSLLYLFRRQLKLGFFPTLVGVITASYSNAFFVKTGHIQLFTLSFVPLFVILILYFFQACKQNILKKRIIYGVLTIFLFNAIMLSNFYTAFFLTIFICILLSILFFTQINLLSNVFFWIKKHIKEVLIYVVIFMFSLIPFFRIYLPVVFEYGSIRSWAGETFKMLPSWFDFINVSDSNLVWYFPLKVREYEWELRTGFPLLTFFLFIVVLVRFFSLKMIKVCKTKHFIFYLAFSILICFLLMIKFHSYSLWWFIYKFVPGGSSIRSVSRFTLFLAMPMGIMLALFLNEMQKKFLKRYHFVFLLILCFIFLENQNKMSISSWKKSEINNYLTSVPSPPASCKTFFLLDIASEIKHPFVINLDAWMIANKYDLFVINGYSGNGPKDYPFVYSNKEEDLARATQWIKKYGIKNTCYYYNNNGIWYTLDSSE